MSALSPKADIGLSGDMSAYMRLRGSRKFFEINIFSFPRFKRLASRSAVLH